MLQVQDLNTFYGQAHILFDVSLQVRAGEVVVLLGRNGAGKSTTLKSIIGLARPRSGSVAFEGRRIEGWEPFGSPGSGWATCPRSGGSSPS